MLNYVNFISLYEPEKTVRKTKQKIIALVTTTLKTVLAITKTNGRVSGHKLYAGNI